MPTTLSGDEDGTKLSGVSLSLQGSCPLLLSSFKGKKQKMNHVCRDRAAQIPYRDYMGTKHKQTL